MATKKTAKKASVKKASVKKASIKKASIKKTTKKAPVKKAPVAKKERDPNALRKPQIRILQALAKSGKPLSRKELADKASVDQAGCVEWVGSVNSDIREANDKKHFPSLVSRKFVRFDNQDINGRDTVVYAITAAGKSEAAKSA